jgi:hypothetical protein
MATGILCLITRLGFEDAPGACLVFRSSSTFPFPLLKQFAKGDVLRGQAHAAIISDRGDWPPELSIFVWALSGGWPTSR